MSDARRYEDQVVVVTGASSGFGRGTAPELARRGSAVVVAARGTEALNNFVRECQAAGGRALAVPTDVSDPDAVAALAQQTVVAFGRVDVWTNNAGVAAVGRFDEVPLADHDQVVRTDLLGTVYGSHHTLRHFRARGRGVLINVATASNIHVPAGG